MGILWLWKEGDFNKMKLKNLTRRMIIELKKFKIKPETYGYRVNAPDRIEVVNKTSGEVLTFNKAEYGLQF